VGLSLTQRIIQIHGGHLTVSIPEEQSIEFLLKFNTQPTPSGPQNNLN
jgi:K+-sensing histidine kinase KdpD